MISFPNVKINLGLRVIRKRNDGFHDIQTLFFPYYGIKDCLEIIKADEYSETSSRLFSTYGAKQGGPSLPDNIPEGYIPNIVQGISENGKLMITIAREEGVAWEPLKDLCAKAYFLLDNEYNLPPVKIFLEKKSPVGAGLGGGSSDAAFSLKMLSEMFALNLSDDALAEYASRLGSDCAFFIYNTPLLGEGRGEKLSPFRLKEICYGEEDEGKYTIKVIVPKDIAVSTAEAYKNIVTEEASGQEGQDIRDILLQPVEKWKDLLKNNFEKTVFTSHPQLERIKRSLYDSGAVYASMSGSGPALFAIYKK